jgi:threonine dehydratase
VTPPSQPEPRIPAARELTAAARRLAGRIRRTPVLELGADELGIPVSVTVKLEQTQHTGSFKARGALNSVLSTSARSVVAASGGNHGAAVAWAARSTGAAADVFLPSTSPESKRRLISGYGARLHPVDGVYADALDASLRFHGEHDGQYVHAYDSPETVAGQATLGAELAEQIPPNRAVLVGCGGGGLYAGVTLALAGRNPVIPVEPVTAPTMTEALRFGHPVDVEVGGIAVDSLGAGRIGSIAFAVATRYAAETITVSDAAIAEAVDVLWRGCRIAAEPGGAAAFAAVLSRHDLLPGDHVAVVVSGANRRD